MGKKVFFTLPPPPLISNLPTLDIVFWVGKSAWWSSQITKRKTIIVYFFIIQYCFKTKSRVGSHHLNSFQRWKFRVGNAQPNNFQWVGRVTCLPCPPTAGAHGASNTVYMYSNTCTESLSIGCF